MNAKQRFKLGAGAGLVTILLGALMVLAPGAGAEDDLVPVLEHRVTICHRTNSVTNPYVRPTVDYDGANGDISKGPDHYEHLGPAFDFDADPDAAYPKPRNGDQWGDIIPPVPLDGGGESTGLNWYIDNDPSKGANTEAQAIWNNGCNAPDEQGEPPVVIVEKQVPDVESADLFKFSVNGGESVEIGDDSSEEFSVSAGSVTVSEDLTDPAGYMLSKVDCTKQSVTADGVDLGVTHQDGVVSFDILDGEVITCVFTNMPVDLPGITIVKAAVPGTNIPSNELFTFDDPFESQFTLAVGQSHTDSDLAGFERGYEYTEVVDPDFPLVYIECGDLTFEDIDPEDQQVAAALAVPSIQGVYDNGDLRGVRIIPDDADVTCTFFNQGDDTPPPPPPPPPPGPSFSVELEKLNDADSDGVFEDSESADAAGDDVEFQISIENTGGGVLTLLSLTDTFDGDTINLLNEVDLDCERNDDPVALAIGSILPIGSTTVCTFTLDDYAPAAGTSLENVVEVDTAQTPPASDESTVSVAEVLPVASGTITVVKQVNEEAPAGWSFDFDGGELGAFELADGDEETSFNVDPGNYSITEDTDLSGGWAFDSAACIDQDDEVVGEADGDGSVDFAVAPDADVTCTFVNEYTPVAPAVVTPTTQPEKVLGVQTVRTLPRTGDETRGLAGVGAFMLALGAAMVIGSRRQLARR